MVKFHFHLGTTVYLVIFSQLLSSKQAVKVSGVQLSLCVRVISSLFTERAPRVGGQSMVVSHSTASFGLVDAGWGWRISSPLREDHRGATPLSSFIYFYSFGCYEA